jgi:hypothetical protein
MDLELSKSLVESQFVVGKAPSQRTFLVQLMTNHAIFRHPLESGAQIIVT